MDFKFRKSNPSDWKFILTLKELGMRWYIEKIYGWDYEIQKQLTIKEVGSNLDNTRIITYNDIDIGVTTFIETDNYYEIGLIAVHPDYRNNGIASKIINDYIDIARKDKKRIVIKTYKDNPAQRLYIRCGFNVYKRDDTHIYLDINFNDKEV
jgi:ribosomal protein S18 acetylase RimI-like enzyme